MQPKGLQQGIYFDLPIEQYHADPALSKSGMMNIVKSWLDYWENSSLNPEWAYTEEDKSRSLEFGSLVDLLLLDRPGFDKKFRTGLDEIFAVDDRKIVALGEYNKAMTAIKELWAVEYCQYILSGGFPQVSIFWRDEETGVMLKTRPDYLKPFMETDYKTIRDLLDSTINAQLVDYGYAVQGAMGIIGITQIKKGLKRKDKDYVVVGDTTPEHKVFIKEFINEPRQDFRFIFQRNSKPYPFKIRHPDDDVNNTAYAIFRACVNRYVECLKLYGTKRPPGGDNKSKPVEIMKMPYRFSTMAYDI